MYKNKKIFVSLLLTFFLFLTACKQAATYPPNVSVNEAQLFLFQPFSNTLGIYDLESWQWNPIDAQGAFFQGFGWGNEYPYFVVGKQNIHEFQAGKINGSDLRFNYSLKNKKEALAPFATDGELFLYMIEQVSEDEIVKRVVTISDDGTSELVANLDGLPVMDGVIAGDYLYFTCYNEDTELFEVWSFDLTQNNPEQQPVLIQNDYTSFQLYQYRGKLLFVDFEKQILYNDEFTIKLSQKADLIMIDDEANILVEEYVTSENLLEISFTDILSGKRIGVYQKAINFTRTGFTVTIYGDGFIEQLDLTKGD